jgi:hypothetical protein
VDGDVRCVCGQQQCNRKQQPKQQAYPLMLHFPFFFFSFSFSFE